MSTVWKALIVLIIVVAAIIGYSQFTVTTDNTPQNSKVTQTPATPARSDNVPATTIAAGEPSRPERDNRERAHRYDNETGLTELEALAQAQEDEPLIEEELELNEETGELIIRDPATGEVLLTTKVDKDLIPLAKENFKLQIDTVIPDGPEGATEPADVAVYPPESSGQAPEKVFLKQDDGRYEVIEIDPADSDLEIIESIPDEETAPR